MAGGCGALLNIEVEEGAYFKVGQIIQNVYLKHPYLVKNYESGLSCFLKDRLSAPFVGRKKTLETLDAWLANKSSPVNLLLTGYAGRGKSTLLVQWVESLRLRGINSHRVIMVPISQTYGIDKDLDFFPALAGVLVSSYPFLGPLPIEIEQKRSFAQSCLKKLADADVALLLVIDGLDEVSGWNFDSTILPFRRNGSSFRIIAASRLEADDKEARHRLKHMGWDKDSVVVLVEGLSDLELFELFSKASNGRYCDTELKRLIELSKGEPLVANLLVAEMENGEDVLQEQALFRASDALSKVMESWVERLCKNISEAERDVVYRLLGALSLAQGGLTRSDLQRILNLTPGEVDRAIKSAKTVLASDGQGGYVLAHLSLSGVLQNILVVGNYDLPSGFARLLVDSTRHAECGEVELVSDYVVGHALAHLWCPHFLFEVCFELLSFSWMRTVFLKTGDTARFQRFVRALQERARQENIKSASCGKLIPYGTVELLCVFWGTVAVEYQAIQIAKNRIDDSAAAELESIQIRHGDPWAPPVYSYAMEIRKLLELRDRIPPSLMLTWQTVADHVVRFAQSALFCAGFDNNQELVSLIKIIRQDFDLEEHVSNLSKASERIEGLLYLLDCAPSGERDVYVERIKRELASQKSESLQASTYVELAVRDLLSFEEAIGKTVVYASRGHQEARTSVDLAASLTAHHIETHGNAECLAGLYERFLAVVPPGDASVCCPLLSVLLRFGTYEQRKQYLLHLFSTETWGDIHEVIADCASGWGEQEVSLLFELLSDEFYLLNKFTNKKDINLYSEQYRDLCGHLVHVAKLLLIVSKETTGQARANAFSKCMELCEFLGVSNLSGSTKEMLFELMEDVSRGADGYEASVRMQVEHLFDLVRAHEAKFAQPWSGWEHVCGVWGLNGDQAAAKILKVIEKWGQAAISRCGIDKLDVDILENLKRQVVVLEDKPLREMALSTIDESLQANNQQRGALRESIRYQKIVSALAGVLLSINNPAAAIELVLDAKEYGWPVLHELSIPDDWEVPCELHEHLVELFSKWRVLKARYPDLEFPYRLSGKLDASHLSWAFILPEAKRFESLAHMGELLQFISVQSRYVELEKVFLDALQGGGEPYRLFSLARSVQRDVSRISDVEGWSRVLYGLIDQDHSFDVSDKLRILMNFGDFGRHQTLWIALCEKAKSRVEAVESNAQRIALRHTIGLEMLDLDKQYCLGLLKSAINTPGLDVDHELSAVFRALLSSSSDAEVKSDINEWVCLSTIENFHIRVEALADDLTLEHLSVLLPFALKSMTYLGRSWNLALVFNRLSESQRDEVFSDWVSSLAERELEERRRFLKVAMDFFSSAFSLKVLKSIFAGEEIDFWEKLIHLLYAKLDEGDAAQLIEPLLLLIFNNSHKSLALELFGRLSVDDTLKAVSELHRKGLVDEEISVKTELAFRYPSALSRSDIRSLQSRYPHIISLASAPAASDVEKDFAWGFMVGKTRSSVSLVEALKNFGLLVDFYYEFGGEENVVVKATRDAAKLLGEGGK